MSVPYRITQSGDVQRVADGALLPEDPANTDWQAYQAWLADGGVPTPYARIIAVAKTSKLAQINGAAQLLVLPTLPDIAQVLAALAAGRTPPADALTRLGALLTALDALQAKAAAVTAANTAQAVDDITL